MKLDFDVNSIEKECSPELWRVSKHKINLHLEAMEWQANMTGSMLYHERINVACQDELDEKYQKMLEEVPDWQVGYLEHLYNAPVDEFWLFEEELRRVGEKKAKFLIREWLREIQEFNIEGYNFSEGWLKEQLGKEIWNAIKGNIKFHLDLMDKLASKKISNLESEVHFFREGINSKDYIKGLIDGLMDSSFEYDQGYLAHVITAITDGEPSYTFRDYLNSIDANAVVYFIKEYLKEFNIYE